MLPRLLILLSFLLLPFPAMAQSLEGHWAFRIDETTIFVFRLDALPDGTWTGAWKRPTAIASNGAVFQRMDGSEVVVAERSGERDGEVQLAFAGPPGSTRGDVLRFRQTSENQAQLTYVGVPGDPFPLIRVRPDTPLGPFDAARIYDRDLAVVEADYEPPAPVEAAVSEVAAAEAVEAGAQDAVADALAAAAAEMAIAQPAAEELSAEEEAPESALPADAPAEAGEAARLALDLPDLPPLTVAQAPEPAVVWEPLGLIDEATAAAAARAALAGESGAVPPPAPPAPAPPPEAAPPEESDAPQIDADFLDGL